MEKDIQYHLDFEKYEMERYSSMEVILGLPSTFKCKQCEETYVLQSKMDIGFCSDTCCHEYYGFSEE